MEKRYHPFTMPLASSSDCTLKRRQKRCQQQHAQQRGSWKRSCTFKSRTTKTFLHVICHIFRKQGRCNTHIRGGSCLNQLSGFSFLGFAPLASRVVIVMVLPRTTNASTFHACGKSQTVREDKRTDIHTNTKPPIRTHIHTQAYLHTQKGDSGAQRMGCHSLRCFGIL